MHGPHELTGMAVTALAALAFGLVMTRIKQPAVVGYILAGVALGPSAFALVTERESIALLAELGVLMLLFLVGMELSVSTFKAVWRIAAITTGTQILVSVLASYALSLVFDWPIGLAILLGFMFAVSSTAVAIKMLEDVGEAHTNVGRITIGILVAQDLAVVPMMLTLDAMAGAGISVLGLGRIVLSLAVLGGLIWFLGRRGSLTLPFVSWIEQRRELLPLAGLSFCFAAAALTGLIGLSPAYGAFLAGMVIGNSRHREQVLSQIEPIQSILLMVFFLSVGLLLDLAYIWDNLGMVLLVLVVVTVAKTALNIAILSALREPWTRAFLTGALLAQIGEFSFLLAAVGLSAGLITADDYPLLVAVTVLSLATSPFWLEIARRLHRMALLGITSGREIMRILSGRQATLVLDAYDTTSRSLLRLAAHIGRGGIAEDGEDGPSDDAAPRRRGPRLGESMMSATRPDRARRRGLGERQDS
ncbi:MAG: cation/H(+) antiporter [Rhodospirillaceae bacterium]|jgi:monovalent cation:H+ antiporter-2, CPA2 family|nr:cation/H(+) antiporter [Rhodospirillaceae bacterium]MBT6117295.1 cation/H(+) antiporter [Rhodospirillaceae bacterium]